LKHGGQAMTLINWLFQDEFVFEAVAMDLTNIIERKEDRYVALGWCILVRGLVEYENFTEQHTLNGNEIFFVYFSQLLCKFTVFVFVKIGLVVIGLVFVCGRNKR
jgi:hypothetical protein